MAMRSRNQRSWLMTTAQPAKLEQRLLQRAQRLHVQVVGRLVQQQHVAAALEHLGQVHAVALAAREVLHLLLLVGALEVEAGHVGARVGICAPAQVELVLPAGDLLPHASCRRRASRGSGRRRPASPSRRCAARRRPASPAPVIIRNSVVLPGAVGADHADDAARRQLEGQVVDQQPVAVAPCARPVASITTSPRRGPGGM